MAADSHPDIVEESLRKLGYHEDNRLKLDCLKVSHHGIKANPRRTCGRSSIAPLRLLDRRLAPRHPDAETIARILKTIRNARRH